MRRVTVALVAVALAAAIFILWPRSDEVSPDGTQALEASTTTSNEAQTTTSIETSTTQPTSTTTEEPSHVVESVEEAEEILRELWFGWFEGIYNQDEDRIREVVASQQMIDAAKNAFGAEFEAEPSPDAVRLTFEILYADDQCLVTWGELDVSAFRGPGAVAESVQVMRVVDGVWKFTTSWANRDDLWEADCDSELVPLQ